MTKYIFFFEIEQCLIKSEEDYLEVDDLQFNEEELNNFPYHDVKELLEIINPEIKEEIELKFKKVIDDFSLSKIYSTLFLVEEIAFQFLIIVFNSEKDYDEIDEGKEYLSIVDSIKYFIRRSRFLSNFFISEDIIKSFYTSYRKTLTRLNIDSFILAYKDTLGFTLNFQGFTGFIPIYYPMRIDITLKRHIKKINRKEFSNIFSDYHIVILPFDFFNLEQANSEFLFYKLYEKIKYYVKNKIVKIYANLKQAIFLYYNCLERLPFNFNMIDTSSIINLKKYMEDLNNIYYPLYPTILFSRFDHFALDNSSLDDLGRIYFSNFFLESREYKENLNIYEELRYFLETAFYKLKFELRRNIQFLDKSLIERKNQDILMIIDALNQSYFLARDTYDYRLGQIEKFIDIVKKPAEDIYKYLFITETLLRDNAHAITNMHNIGWNLFYFLKEKKSDFDSRLITFTEQLSNLKLGNWSKVILISADSDLINYFIIKFGKNSLTELFIAISPGNQITNPNLILSEEFQLDLNIYHFQK